MRAHRLAIFGVIGTLLIGLAIWSYTNSPAPDGQDGPKARLGLMTSLPIYWNESAGLDDMLTDGRPAHWARTQLEQEFDLVPLDILAEPDSTEPSEVFGDLNLLLLAQPRALPPVDMVALDSWVRKGGWVLIFADPMLTEHSEFGFGDQRRPQDIAMLSPIFARWGLQQFYDEDQVATPRAVMFRDVVIPINKAGRFEALPDGEADCELVADGVIAICTIGQGRAIILADAFVLEGESNSEVAQTALDRLVWSSIRYPKNQFAH